MGDGKLLEEFKQHFTFFHCQPEIAPTTGKLHLQGYCEVKNAMLGSRLQNLFGAEMRIEPARGTAAQNITYTEKQDTKAGEVIKFGEPKKQGKRTDLEKMYKAIKKGASKEDIQDNYTALYCRYPRAINDMLSSWQRPQPRTDIKIHYYWGQPGIGKSTLVEALICEEADKGNVYIAKESKEGWFCRYAGQTIVVFDEFKGIFPLHLMLQLLSKGRLTLPVKGGDTIIKATEFYFTSNFQPHQVYDGDPAWLQRILGPRYALHEVLANTQLIPKFVELNLSISPTLAKLQAKELRPIKLT